MPIIRDTRTIVSGVASVAKSGDAAITGAVTLTAGAGITLTEAGQDITIASSAPAATVLPQLLGPVALNTGAAPQTQVLWTFNQDDIILDIWLEVTAAMDAGTAYEIYCDVTDFMFPGAGSFNGPDFQDTSRFFPSGKNISLIASFCFNGSASALPTVPSRMKATTAVTCDKTAGAAGGSGNAYALVIRR